MADNLEVRGLDDLVAVSRALKAAGDSGKGLRKELYAGLNRAAKPVRADLNATVPETFPSGGGLAAEMARRAKFAVSTRTGARNAGVRLVARGKGRNTLRAASVRGELRHPVFGNRRVWVTQSAGIRAGLAEAAFEKDKPVVQREVVKAIEHVRDEIYRRTR